MTQIPIQWNDQTFVWGSSENFEWSEAYRVIQEVKSSVTDWSSQPTWERIRKKVPTETAEKFLEIVVKVNGLSRSYKQQKSLKNENMKITVDHIQKTFQEFETKKVSVKAEIK